MPAETLPLAKEPLIDVSHLGASLDRIDQLVMPISEPILRGVQYGDIQSRVRGQGAERDGVRDYIPGDDPRYIDWKLTARSADGVPKLRQHLKDITPDLWLVTDAPRSRNRITPGIYTEQQIALSAVLGMVLLAEKEGMPRRLLAVNDHERFDSGSAELGRESVLHYGRQLVRLSESRTASGENQHLGGLLRQLGAVAHESLVVIVSDFRDTLSPDGNKDGEHGWRRPLAQLKLQGNGIIAIETTNSDDFAMSRVGKPMLGAGVVWKGFGREARTIDNQYAELAAKNQAEIDAALKGVQASHVKLSADDGKWFTKLRADLRKADRAGNQ